MVIVGLAVTGAFELLIRFQTLVHIGVDMMDLLGLFRLQRLRPDLHRPLQVPACPSLPFVTVVLTS